MSRESTKWSLYDMDNDLLIEGQYEAENLTETISANWSSTNTLGRKEPIMQFINGGQDSITFDTIVRTVHQGQLPDTGPAIYYNRVRENDIGEYVNIIKDLPRVDDKLGRPRIFELAVGEQISTKVVVKSVGGIRYERLRNDGSVRGIRVSFSFDRYEPFDAKKVSGLNESLITSAKEGETFEHVTARIYRQPDLGEALRRRNPDLLDLEPGELIHIPPAKNLRREVTPLQPQSLFMKRGTKQDELYKESLKIHGGSFTTYILRTDF